MGRVRGEIVESAANLFFTKMLASKERPRTWTGLVKMARWRLADELRPEETAKAIDMHLERWEFRRAGNHPQGYTPSPVNKAVDGLVVESLRVALRKLRPDEYWALYRHHLGGQSLQRMASEDGVRLSTIRSRVARALKTLAKLVTSEAAQNPELSERVARRLGNAGDASTER